MSIGLMSASVGVLQTALLAVAMLVLALRVPELLRYSGIESG